MSNLAAIIADVYSVTNRPDLVAETAMAVRAATLKAHQSDFYAKDLVQSGIQWSIPAYVQSLQYATLFPRFKALKYLRKYDNTGLVAGDLFTVLSPENIMDSYGIEKTNVCYLAGQCIEIKSDSLDTYMLFGFYQYPDVTVAGYTSWIADTHPFAIVYEAARSIFKMIGFDAQSVSIDKSVQEEYRQLQVSNLALIGE